MVIKVGACRVCAEKTNEFLAKHKSIYAYHTSLPGHNGVTTFTININGDPRTAAYKSLFAQAWEKCKVHKFPYHATEQHGNVIHCSNYPPPPETEEKK